MSKHKQWNKAKLDKLSQSRVKPAIALEQVQELPDVVGSPACLASRARNSTIETQATRLGDPRFRAVQRQTIASQIGRIRGNGHLQRVMSTISNLQRQENEATSPQTNSSETDMSFFESLSPDGIVVALYDVTESHHLPTSCPICQRYVREKIALLADTHFSSGHPMSVDPELTTSNLFQEAEAWHIHKSHEDPRRFALGDMRFFQSEAERFARDYHAVALNGNNAVGQGAMPVATVEDLSLKIRAVSERVEALLRGMGNPQASTSSLVKTVALFGHGGSRWMGIGGNLRPRQARQLVQNVRERLTSNISVVLYACSTAAGRQEGEGTLADVIHDALVQEGSHTRASVWGHTGPGVATAYPFWREFSGQETEGGGQAFFDEAFPAEFIDTEAQQLNLTRPRQRRQLTLAMRLVYAREMRGDHARNLPFKNLEARHAIVASLQQRWHSSRHRERLDRRSNR